MTQKVLVLLTCFCALVAASGCGKDKSQGNGGGGGTASSPSAPARDDGTAALLADVQKFQEFEKDMRAYGVDVEEKWVLKNGTLGPVTRINLEERTGERIYEQIGVLTQYIGRGLELKDKHHKLLEEATRAQAENGASKSSYSAVLLARELVNVRLRLAGTAILKLRGRVDRNPPVIVQP